MKLLQVNNVQTLLGGTGQCALSITHALPDFDHRVHFFDMDGVDPDVQDEFGDVSIKTGTSISQEDLEWADLVIFHNTSMINMPHRVPENCATVYYQHSNHKSARFCVAQCDIGLTVSHFLKSESKLSIEVIHQPVKRPFKRNDRTFIGNAQVARMCTPNPEKWENIEPLYDAAFREFSQSCTFWFIGATPSAKLSLSRLASDHGAVAEFRDASTTVRSDLHWWDVLLYSSPLTETYGRTVCEAQMCGCVPVVDNRGGFRDQIKHGYDGFLCNSIPEFMTAIDDVIYDRQRGFEMSQKAQISGSKRGSVAEWRNKFMNILKGKK